MAGSENDQNQAKKGKSVQRAAEYYRTTPHPILEVLSGVTKTDS